VERAPNLETCALQPDGRSTPARRPAFDILEKCVLASPERSVAKRPNFSLERALRARGYLRVAGVDEAGRGPLAGPVVAAAAILPFPEREWFQLLGDSKQLSEKRRLAAHEALSDNGAMVGTGVVPAELIDAEGIVTATHEAMRRAVQALPLEPDHLLIDGFALRGTPLPQQAVVGGDALCYSIAAASIVAKVTRDGLMHEIDETYPGYGFAGNKGYGTEEHLECLRRLGPCPEHRRSFVAVSQLTLDIGVPRDGGRRGLGALGESIACRELEAKGYRVVARNYRAGNGEIDVIAEGCGCLVFVEVKTRRPGDRGRPEEAITPRKRRHLVDCAQAYLQTLDNPPADWRIDLATVELTARSTLASVRFIESAVEEEP